MLMPVPQRILHGSHSRILPSITWLQLCYKLTATLLLHVSTIFTYQICRTCPQSSPGAHRGVEGRSPRRNFGLRTLPVKQSLVGSAAEVQCRSVSLSVALTRFVSGKLLSLSVAYNTHYAEGNTLRLIAAMEVAIRECQGPPPRRRLLLSAQRSQFSCQHSRFPSVRWPRQQYRQTRFRIRALKNGTRDPQLDSHSLLVMRTVTR